MTKAYIKACSISILTDIYPIDPLVIPLSSYLHYNLRGIMVKLVSHTNIKHQIKKPHINFSIEWFSFLFLNFTFVNNKPKVNLKYKYKNYILMKELDVVAPLVVRPSPMKLHQ